MSLLQKIRNYFDRRLQDGQDTALVIMVRKINGQWVYAETEVSGVALHNCTDEKIGGILLHELKTAMRMVLEREANH